MNRTEEKPKITIRIAKEEDIDIVLNFIKELAEYEHLLDQFVATREVLFRSMFVKHQAEALIGEYQGKPVGFALFFENFSTFLGKANLYLEDIYVKPEYRRLGLGKAFFLYLAKLCMERGYERMDWSCLNWNESSIRFYKSMGAVPMSDWTVYRIDGQSLIDFANQNHI